MTFDQSKPAITFCFIINIIWYLLWADKLIPNENAWFTLLGAIIFSTCGAFLFTLGIICGATKEAPWKMYLAVILVLALTGLFRGLFALAPILPKINYISMFLLAIGLNSSIGILTSMGSKNLQPLDT